MIKINLLFAIVLFFHATKAAQGKISCDLNPTPILSRFTRYPTKALYSAPMIARKPHF